MHNIGYSSRSDGVTWNTSAPVLAVFLRNPIISDLREQLFRVSYAAPCISITPSFPVYLFYVS